MATYNIKLVKDSMVDWTAATASVVDTGATITKMYDIAYMYRIEATPEQLAAIPNLEYSEDVTTSVTFAAQSYNISHLTQVIDPTGVAVTYTPRHNGSGTRVFLVDTGIDSDHPEFTGATINNLWSNFGADFEDTVGHGTMTASLIVGQNIGVARQTDLQILKLFNGATGSITVGEIVDAFEAILISHNTNRDETKVVCLPWNISQNSFVDSFVQNLNEENLIVVAAAGNDGVDVNTVSPGGVNNIITVGAHNSEFEVSGFTNFPYGASSDPYYTNYGAQVDIFAPGVGVSVATTDGAYGTADGTSVSAALVAGAAALYINEYPGNNSDQIKNIMIAEGSYQGSTLLSFATVTGVDYSQVNRSILTVESSTSNSFAVLPSGELATVQRGTNTSHTIGIKAEATNVEVLDFAPLPPFANINLTTGVVVVDTSSLPESMAPGKYLFAVKGEMAGEISVEEYSIGIYESAATELDDTANITSYYYDADNTEYDAVVNYQVSTAKF